MEVNQLLNHPAPLKSEDFPVVNIIDSDAESDVTTETLAVMAAQRGKSEIICNVEVPPESGDDEEEEEEEEDEEYGYDADRKRGIEDIMGALSDIDSLSGDIIEELGDDHLYDHPSEYCPQGPPLSITH